MNIRTILMICMTSMSLASASTLAAAQAQLKSTTQVRRALGTLNRVVVHTQRLIDANNFVRLPHENTEFKDGVEALHRSIAGESPQFKRAVAPLIERSREDSQKLADAADAHDSAGAAAAHAALAASVKSLFAAFPEQVQPSAPPAPTS